MRLAAKIVLILALVVGALAVGDFAYNAYRRTDCLTGGGELDKSRIWGDPRMPSDLCTAEIAERDEHLQLDAAGTLVAAALLMGSILASRKLKPHRR